ncbi:tautomerase family protein [Nesterenkonia sp. YGD6]|uniref:tautomerase family protein n=1 Tax=Nesterenkonia sp. YGD6 TaxID=2901231 RepID=UPI001F4C8A3F|nr:tautomerase family protein [Nesterenkonia sp. YGD6]MCH8563676.1 tautomerase family protein [Nesterenkonia sp. YGD6]
MPLINIDVIRGRTPGELQVLLDSVHSAMVEALEVPDTDRYQILTQHDPNEMIALDTGLGIERSQALTVLRFISRQRPAEAKEKLYRLLATRLQENCGTSPQDLIVSVAENEAADWSFGNGRAQFLTGEL